MPDFNFTLPTQAIMGPGTVSWAGSMAAALGDRVLLVAEPILNDAKVTGRVVDVLKSKGIEPIVFDEIRSVAASATVDDALAIARGARANLVIGLGGIGVQAVARAVAVLAPAGIESYDFLDGNIPEVEPLPFMEILSTCRDPFMFRDEVLMVDSRDRTTRIIKTGKRAATAVISDPDLSASLQGKMPALVALDALLPAIEGYISTKGDFLSDTLLEKAIASLSSAIASFTTNPGDVPARKLAAEGGFLAALGLATSSPGLGSALSFAINGRYRTLKPSVSSIFLPYILEGAIKSSVEKTATIARLLGEDVENLSVSEAANKAAENLRVKIGALKMPARLKDLGLNIDELVEIAETVRKFDLINYLPRAVSVEDIYDIIKQAY
jgi:alcohol dehydrogenase